MAYGEGPITVENVTDDQIRALRERVTLDLDWAGGGGTRDRMIKACDRALESRIFRGALGLIVAVLNEELKEQ